VGIRHHISGEIFMCAVYQSSVELCIYHAGIIGTVYLSSVELSIYHGGIIGIISLERYSCVQYIRAL
jgi:hypothetical protein